MTYQTTITPPASPLRRDIIGPYSPWPRRGRKVSAKQAASLGAAATLGGVFAHCVLPLLG